MSSPSNSTASPPPPDDDSSSSSTNPPPPSSSSSSPPPSSSSSSSSPPPPTSQTSPPPSPPSSDDSPPSENQSPPPPSSDGGDDSSPPAPPPPSDDDSSSSFSPPPPPSPSSDNDDDSNSPPPPPSKNNNSHHVPPPPPRSSSRTPSSGALSPPPPPSTQNSSPPLSSGPSQETIQKIAIGASVGVGLLLIMFIISCVCAAKKKKKRKQEAMHYYGPPKGGDQYYNSSQHPNWRNQQSGDHVVKLPPPPNSMGMPSSGGWPAQPPPPPPPMMSSGEMSSNFSGPRGPPLPPPSPNLALGFNKSTFTYDELAAATGNFSQANLLGQGGFGYVHKGVFPNGKEVAVKSLKTGSGQGEREFQAEVEIISRVHHRHLVSLVGYCIAGGQRMLVYEFVPNKTLEYHLHGTGTPIMDFPSRLRIALGSAKGLAYLHEDCHPRIIHRDIKAANILIDYNFEAMVADFGLAKLSSDNYTHVSTRIMGTFGYLAPEYAASGKLTEKSDVFSYGVMLLELITGKRPVDNTNTMMEDSLVDWARPLMARALENGDYGELVDSRLENNFNPQEMARMVACAAATIRHSARRRPKMSQIVRALEGDVSLEDLNEVARPGQSSAYSSNEGSSDYDTGAYNADMKKFKKMALSSQEFSGEYGSTGEFGGNSSGEMSQSGKSKAQY